MNPITFEIEKDGDQWHTWSPELPGCHTHGKTVKEALENLKDAVQLYLEDIKKKRFSNRINNELLFINCTSVTGRQNAISSPEQSR